MPDKGWLCAVVNTQMTFWANGNRDTRKQVRKLASVYIVWWHLIVTGVVMKTCARPIGKDLHSRHSVSLHAFLLIAPPWALSFPKTIADDGTKEKKVNRII